VVNKDTKVVVRLGSTPVGIAAICAVVSARICGDLRLFIWAESRYVIWTVVKAAICFAENEGS
jgi:hypothetical protein